MRRVVRRYNTEADAGDVIESFTQYDGSADQKLLYTLNFKGGSLLDANKDFATSDVVNSTVYNYIGRYLDNSMTLRGYNTEAGQGDSIESFTKYDGSSEQKLEYTLNFRGDAVLDPLGNLKWS